MREMRSNTECHQRHQIATLKPRQRSAAKAKQEQPQHDNRREDIGHQQRSAEGGGGRQRGKGA